MSTNWSKKAIKGKVALGLVDLKEDPEMEKLKGDLQGQCDIVKSVQATLMTLPPAMGAFSNMFSNVTGTVIAQIPLDSPLAPAARQMEAVAKKCGAEIPEDATQKFEKLVLTGIQEWLDVFEQKEQEFKEFEEACAVYTHYDRKVKGMKEDRQKRQAKGKQMTDKQLEKMTRNEGKLADAEAKYQAAREQLKVGSMAFLSSTERRVAQLGQRVAQYQVFFFKKQWEATQGLQTPLKTFGARVKKLTAKKPNSPQNAERDKEAAERLARLSTPAKPSKPPNGAAAVKERSNSMPAAGAGAGAAGALGAAGAGGGADAFADFGGSGGGAASDSASSPPPPPAKPEPKEDWGFRSASRSVDEDMPDWAKAADTPAPAPAPAPAPENRRGSDPFSSAPSSDPFATPPTASQQSNAEAQKAAKFNPFDDLGF